MSPDRDPGRREDEGHEMDDYEVDPPRSIFSALWFRALLAVLVLGVLAAVAVPYILDFATHQTSKSTAAKAAKAATTTPTPPTPAPAAAPGATPPPASPAAPEASPPAPAPPTPSAAPASASPAPAPPAPAVAAPKSSRPAAPPAFSPAPEKPKPVTVAKADDTSPDARKAAGKPSAATVAAAAGPYWVQVGAFKDPETAKRVADRLREQGFQAEQSTTSRSAPSSATPPPPPTPESQGDRYHVVVSGASAADVDAKIAAKGMTSESTAGGVVVQPSLPLREAVGLSRDLADAGLTVQVRRVGGAPAVATTPVKETQAGVTLHRVRVGGFPDRATALAASKQLEEKGFKPFIARGGQ